VSQPKAGQFTETSLTPRYFRIAIVVSVSDVSRKTRSVSITTMMSPGEQLAIKCIPCGLWARGILLADWAGSSKKVGSPCSSEANSWSG
jgi:hypothetical protein